MGLFDFLKDKIPETSRNTNQSAKVALEKANKVLNIANNTNAKNFIKGFDIINVYDEDFNKIIAEVNLNTKNIQTIPNSGIEALNLIYVLHFLVKNFDSQFMSLAIERFDNLSTIMHKVAKQGRIQKGEVKNFDKNKPIDIEIITDDQIIEILTNSFFDSAGYMQTMLKNAFK